MTPEELAEKFPRLYHITTPGASDSIKKHGLLSTIHLLDKFEVTGERSLQLTEELRHEEVPISHPVHGSAILNDQCPMSVKALKGCLDDDLTPEDWARMLNERVFFWPTREACDRHLHAKGNNGRSREVIVVDTLRLLKDYADKVELCPINSGCTVRKAARRGLKTFTPITSMSFVEWTKLRGGRDTVTEIVVRKEVDNIAEYIVDIFTVKC